MEDCVCIENLPAPLPISKVSPDKLIEDILVSTSGESREALHRK
jgi:hypothetical protein